MLNPVWLRTFITLAESGHFTRTAEQLAMTQPGVSQHIRKLEEHLGTPLLLREGKQFELTDAGESLLAHARRHFEEEADFLARVSEDHDFEGSCQIGCSGAVAMRLYPLLLEEQTRHRNLSFALEAAPNPRIIHLLEQKKIGMGIVTQPQTGADIAREKIGQEELCLILPAGQSHGWDQLMDLGFINHPDGHHYASQVLEQNYPNKFNGMEAIQQSGYVNQLSQILIPVSQGLGFTVLPQSALSSFHAPDRIHVAELPNPVRETLYLITRKRRPLAKRYQILRGIILAAWQSV